MFIDAIGFELSDCYVGFADEVTVEEDSPRWRFVKTFSAHHEGTRRDQDRLHIPFLGESPINLDLFGRLSLFKRWVIDWLKPFDRKKRKATKQRVNEHVQIISLARRNRNHR
jgi:hypothetical protein